MIIIGLILLLIGYFTGIAILWTIGVIVLIWASCCGSWEPWVTPSEVDDTTSSQRVSP